MGVERQLLHYNFLSSLCAATSRACNIQNSPSSCKGALQKLHHNITTSKISIWTWIFDSHASLNVMRMPNPDKHNATISVTATHVAKTYSAHFLGAFFWSCAQFNALSYILSTCNSDVVAPLYKTASITPFTYFVENDRVVLKRPAFLFVCRRGNSAIRWRLSWVTALLKSQTVTKKT